ncbi:MAG: GNAT family N-acetyltransferase [Telmatospirillum sp.]|nr:GNAT family N-acetyltransferase [Telmatospirillum sp.]
MDRPDPILSTKRLNLRPARTADSGAISGYRSLPEVARYQSWSRFDADDARTMLEGQAGLAPDTPDSWFQLVIEDGETAEVIGDLALHFAADDHRQVEVGINLNPSRQGCGLAGEALERVLAYLFDDLGKHRVTAVTDADNGAAARLFLHAGFRREGHFVENIWFKGAYGSEFLFALLAREWRDR